MFKMKLCWVYDATSNSSQKQLHIRESEVNNLQFAPQGDMENTIARGRNLAINIVILTNAKVSGLLINIPVMQGRCHLCLTYLFLWVVCRPAVWPYLEAVKFGTGLN